MVNFDQRLIELFASGHQYDRLLVLAALEAKAFQAPAQTPEGPED
jgi:hypothetical protein